MYFLLYAYTFDDVMKVENVEFKNLDFPENKKSFQSKIKNIFPSLTSALV